MTAPEPAPTADAAYPARGAGLSPRLRPVWRLLWAACVAAALVHPSATALSRRSWLADLICHFQEPALGVTLLALGASAVGRRPWAAAGLALLAASQVGPLVRYAGPNPVAPDPRSPQRLRILVANVLYTNQDHEALARLIDAERPDVLALVEVTPDWVEALARFRWRYPYGREYPAGGSGLALWFREPPVSTDPPEWPAQGGNPVLHATLDFAGRPLEFWLVHPVSPMSREPREGGNPELDAIARRVGEADGPRVVVGDMNTSDGSAHFGDFLRVSGLRDSRLGFGRQPTWPSRLLYRIAIDHAFVSDDLAVVGRRLGPDIGSDHFPVVVDLAPAATTNPEAHDSQTATSR